MLPIKEYDGTFSFVSSRLYDNIRSVMPNYEEKDPETWPYITLATIERNCPYQGYPDLPAGVAYQRSVLERYEDMYSAEDRKQSVSLNGSFHKKYPFNYDEDDKLKDEVEISTEEYERYMEVEPEEVALDIIDEFALTMGDEEDHELPRPRRERTSIARRNKVSNHECCANRKCIELKREAARLRGQLFDRESQLISSQHELKDYQVTESWRRNAVSNAEYELEKEKQRADAAEKECMLRKKNSIELMERIKDLESRVARSEELEAYCTQLEADIVVLKSRRPGKRSRVIDVDSDEDLMEGVRLSKMMRSSSLLDSEG